MFGLCPACEAELVEIRSKRVCPFCHIIVETCCDGGECRPPVNLTPAQRWQQFTDKYRQARLDQIAKQQGASRG